MLPLVLGAVGLGLLVYWWRSRSQRPASASASLYVLLHDGSSSWLYPAERLENGAFRVAGAEYPAGEVRLVDDLVGLGAPLYVIAIEPFALTKHRAMEQYRATIIKGALFKSGGDVMELLRIGAAASVIAAAIFIYMSVSSLGGQISRQEAILQKVDRTLSSPLVVAPGGE